MSRHKSNNQFGVNLPNAYGGKNLFFNPAHSTAGGPGFGDDSYPSQSSDFNETEFTPPTRWRKLIAFLNSRFRVNGKNYIIFGKRISRATVIRAIFALTGLSASFLLLLYSHQKLGNLSPRELLQALIDKLNSSKQTKNKTHALKTILSMQDMDLVVDHFFKHVKTSNYSTKRPRCVIFVASDNKEFKLLHNHVNDTLNPPGSFVHLNQFEIANEIQKQYKIKEKETKIQSSTMQLLAVDVMVALFETCAQRHQNMFLDLENDEISAKELETILQVLKKIGYLISLVAIRPHLSDKLYNAIEHPSKLFSDWAVFESRKVQHKSHDQVHIDLYKSSQDQ